MTRHRGIHCISVHNIHQDLPLETNRLPEGRRVCTDRDWEGGRFINPTNLRHSMNSDAWLYNRGVDYDGKK